ncbi:hypothetical protein chiPu_0008066 [Chiloscyllium punctatum]|uniref:Uncharacterized protein n=1 Tax=Chiloscyllium punctatum TaxID=137246 RepID=A0A401SGZ8_CHIPU|nr:hypothetical protein [Chiloscyllium punctatum]
MDHNLVSNFRFRSLERPPDFKITVKHARRRTEGLLWGRRRSASNRVEVLTRKKLTANWFLLPVPHHLDQSDNYCYQGRLSNDIYRRPWTRGTMLSTSKLMSCDSVLTEWKKHICTENFLER